MTSIQKSDPTDQLLREREIGQFRADEDDDKAWEKELHERLERVLGKTHLQIKRLTNRSLTLSGRQDWRDDP